jgi:hypothetical protein
MNEYPLSEEDLSILDLITNLEPLLEYQLSGFWLAKNQSLGTLQLNEILNKLSHLQLISLQKDEYQRVTISLNHLMKEKIETVLSDLWKRRKIEKSTLLAEAEKDYIGVLKLLELKSTFDDKPRIGFSDYYMDSQSHQFCQRLTEIGMVFKNTWSSSKHYYEDYYLRKVPFSVEKVLEDFVVSKVNLEGLDLQTDWRALAVLLFSGTPPMIEDLKVNFPSLTLDEINEIIFRLEKRGILSREGTELKILKATKDIIKNYFILNRYQSFKTLIIQELRNRISERTSNLYLLGLIKRILTSVGFQKTSEPFFSIKRTLIRNVSDDDIKEVAKLGLVFPTTQEVIVASEVLLELEEALKSALSEETVYRVPAGEIFTAIAVWKEIFGNCEDYIKIEDEYVNEETLEIIQSYSPVGVELTVLSSIKGARDLDIEEMERRIKAIRNSGRKIELFFIGYEHNEEALFHERYIISKNVCYLLSNSMKQIGRSKSASVALISKEKKTGIIEPAFDYWIGSQKEKLKEIGVIRMTLEEWLKHKSA